LSDTILEGSHGPLDSIRFFSAHQVFVAFGAEGGGHVRKQSFFPQVPEAHVAGVPNQLTSTANWAFHLFTPTLDRYLRRRLSKKI
jgi:hypothetical protein